MAPVANNLTGRYWLDYTTGRREHTLMVRFKGATPAFSLIENDLLAFLNGIAGGLADTWRPLRARWSAANTTISLPLSMSAGLAAFVGGGIGIAPERDEPREAVYVGRSSTTGRRVRLSVYGIVGDTPANYRFGPGESPLAAPAGFNALNAPEDNFCTADGSEATWYTYVNVNYNSYWETRARIG